MTCAELDPKSLSVNCRATALDFGGLQAVLRTFIIANLMGAERTGHLAGSGPAMALSVLQHEVLPRPLSRLTFLRQQLEFPQPVHSPNALWQCLGNVKPPKSQTWSPLSITVSPFYSQRGGVSQGLCSGCHGDSLFPFPTRMEPVFSDHLGRGLKNKPQI